MLELDDIADVVAGAVREATAPLIARIDALEKRELLLPEKGEPGEPGRDGAPGEPGRDGIGLADALIDKDGHLVLTMTDGRTKSLCCVVGRDGEPGRDGTPGKDGADGLGFEHMSVEQVNERTIAFMFRRDTEEAEVSVTLPVPIYRGVYKDGGEYERGDLTTWGGSLWHCNEPKGLKPGAPDSGWQLAAKAGRPGKDAAK